MFHFDTLASLVDFHVIQDVVSLVIYGVVSTCFTALGHSVHRRIRDRQSAMFKEDIGYDD